MKIAMIGAGYVGLTTGACFGQFGHQVTCVDIDPARVSALRAGQLPIYEPGLDLLVEQQISDGRLSFCTVPEDCVGEADAVFLAVGTPALPDGDTDLRYILAAADAVAPLMRQEAVLVIKSTVPAGTARFVGQRAAAVRDGQALSVASNPEFLREGSALKDFTAPDRVVIGADDERSRRLLQRLYQPMAERTAIVVTSTIDAELTKYAANALLALKIGFVNDLADLCEVAGGDVRHVATGIGLDQRIGNAFLQPGPGFGGSCFPKDTRSLASTGRRFGAPQPLVEALVAQNDQRKRRLADRIVSEVGAGGVVAILGTAFKAETDDVRESAALAVIPALRAAGIEVRAHDPKARQSTLRMVPDLQWHDTPYEAAAGADAIVILTEWDEYRRLDLGRIGRLLAGNTILDFRNVLDADQVERSGLRLVPLGRAAAPLQRRYANHGGNIKQAELAASPR